jgi:hypothetical protein
MRVAYVEGIIFENLSLLTYYVLSAGKKLRRLGLTALFRNFLPVCTM